ncbi:DUF6378 domain-containing protein [Segniliparus rugosus]|uniref:DUF6378 domain-containing protein n=1 Tax=Segniliparus rugosus (strain ATCC BAA-974 / DSM 45345 / CCUG 50838 / CIP 108380 / JCM 13579 / CDC 945) TaxID=679197 RepID=E5XRW7_SEGRC|nr:DUF6378 domain-containing protein [Segniliparus rugosus]EFV12902.1 hypothetical protein HMPREF9336_02239 [Segniliparus rugosus ATCC BAA-974]
MNALEEAESLVNGDRLEEWGDPRESFSRIAELWSAYLGVEVSSVDVAQLMILLKVSRGRKKFSRDSIVDIIGYAALAEKINEDARSKPRQWDSLQDVPDGIGVWNSEGVFYEPGLVSDLKGEGSYRGLHFPYTDAPVRVEEE